MVTAFGFKDRHGPGWILDTYFPPLTIRELWGTLSFGVVLLSGKAANELMTCWS